MRVRRWRLGDCERNSPGQLSGGGQQRVAIACALIDSPNVLLADAVIQVKSVPLRVIGILAPKVDLRHRPG